MCSTGIIFGRSKLLQSCSNFFSWENGGRMITKTSALIAGAPFPFPSFVLFTLSLPLPFLRLPCRLGEAPLCSFFLGQYALSLESCQWRAPIVRFNRYSGTSPLGHLYLRDTKNVHIIFVFVTSFEATPLFRGKGHFFKVLTPRFNLHSGDTLALKKWLTTGHNGATVFKIRTIS